MKNEKEGKDFDFSLVAKVVGGVTLAAVGYVVVKKFNNAGKGITEDISKAMDTVNPPSLTELSVNKDNVTIDVSTMAIINNNIYAAMNQAGTNTKTIFENLSKLKTKDDLLFLISVFGLKKYWIWGRSLVLGEKINLNSWFKKELSGSDLRKVGDLFKKFNVPF